MAAETLLESLVKKPTWKELLYELIDTKKLDPWNVDIISLADGFVKRIKEMKSLELGIPANLILAASILLRRKSEAVVWEEPEPPPVAFAEDTFMPEELPPLSLAARLSPKRQVTLDELVEEIEKSIRYETIRPPVKRGGIESIVALPLAEVDIEKQMDETYAMLVRLRDRDGWVVFSRLLDQGEEMVPLLLSLLHLAQKEQIALEQKVFFDEILIRVMESKREIAVKN